MEPAPIKPMIPFEQLDGVDIRVGTILSVDDVPDSRKLLRFRVDLGDHERTVLAGMKQERDDPSVMIGVQTLFVVNLEPRKMAGEISEAMFLDLGFADGINPALAVPERAVPNGTRAR